jgi:hypothetical protein
MASEKAIYWLALGVAALGLNSTYQRSESFWLHRLADRSVQTAECVAQRGLTLISMAEVMIGRNPADVARLQGSLARLEARSEALPAVQMSRDMAQTRHDLQHLQVELRGLKVAVPKVRCPDSKIAMDVREQLADLNVPELPNQEIYVEVPQVDLRGLESLQSMHSFDSLKSMESLQSLRSLESLRSMGDFQFAYPQIPSGRVQIKIHKKSDGGTI